jgi:pyruvate/2-oxoglutarate dehydrogenase complex dihydrolipoamide dehydrogenase (E3) component
MPAVTMKVDAIIIGSGQGGNPLAYALAELGWSVALVEEAYLGGTCINNGCTPTKTMIASAQVAHYAREADRWGVRAENVSVDLKTVIARKRKVVEQFRASQQRLANSHKSLRLYRGHARFKSPREIKVDNDVLQSTRIFVDTGVRARIPHVPGLDTIDYLTNVSIMELTEIPEHLLVLGGGYVGLEFGQMFRRFGSRVTVIDHGPRILPLEDPELVAELQKALEAEGITFLLNSTAVRAEKTGGETQLNLDRPDGPSTVSGSHLLAAIGRVPNTDDLGLERADVETLPSGHIKVNGRLETNVPGIWAIGDVNGGPAFTHTSYNDFQIIYGNLVEGKNLSTENRIVPYSVYTDPELGGVGITEQKARMRGYKLKIGRMPMSYVARAIERGETAGVMKIVVDASDDRILGGFVLGAEGGEIVQIIGTVMLAGLPYTLLKGAIYIHPTMAEGFFGLMEDVKPVN